MKEARRPPVSASLWPLTEAQLACSTAGREHCTHLYSLDILTHRIAPKLRVPLSHTNFHLPPGRLFPFLVVQWLLPLGKNLAERTLSRRGGGIRRGSRGGGGECVISRLYAVWPPTLESQKVWAAMWRQRLNPSPRASWVGIFPAPVTPWHMVVYHIRISHQASTVSYATVHLFLPWLVPLVPQLLLYFHIVYANTTLHLISRTINEKDNIPLSQVSLIQLNWIHFPINM